MIKKIVKNFILDSSVYISYLNPKDALYIETKKFIDKITSPDVNFIVPIVVFLEVGNVLQKSLLKLKNEDLMKFFDDHTIVNLDLQLAEELLMIFKNFNLKTSDAIILGSAIINNAILITWDEKLVKEARKVVNSQTPKSFLKKTDR